jgi:hypothetical protein
MFDQGAMINDPLLGVLDGAAASAPDGLAQFPSP